MKQQIGRPTKYPFEDLAVGESFAIRNLNSGRALCCYWNKKLKRNYFLNRDTMRIVRFR